MGSFDEIIIQDEKERLFTSYVTVEIKDKQGQFVPISTFKKAFYKFLVRGATLHVVNEENKHSPLVIGKVISGEDEVIGNYKAFKILCQIYPSDPENPIYDETWEGIKSGKFKGVSIGGGKPIGLIKNEVNGDKTVELATIPLMEICVVERPANPLALITSYSMAKSDEVIDTITLNIPLLTRLFEFALESKLDDVELHKMLEKLIEASKQGNLTMDDYAKITNTNLEKSEANTMVETPNTQNASEVVDLAKSLQMMSESMSKMYSMMEKVYSKLDKSEEPTAPNAEAEQKETPAEESKEEAKEEQEDNKEAKDNQTEPNKEEINKTEDVASDKPEEGKEDVSDIAEKEKEGDNLEKSDKSLLEAKDKEIESLKHQLAQNIQKSITPGAPTTQREGAMSSSPKTVWEAVLKEKGFA